ncbi:Transcription factor 4 [Bagarius yarrelli]|uniref:Transcription factor 4 n=1 Tax=Bagarius yarrelli TaxID=175774 RepID=A0A556TUD4_BAGYA|nr:Transcription factor 4 [Bagarius yarrelli]
MGGRDLGSHDGISPPYVNSRLAEAETKQVQVKQNEHRTHTVVTRTSTDAISFTLKFFDVQVEPVECGTNVIETYRSQGIMGGEMGMVSPGTVSPTKPGSQYYQHYSSNQRRRPLHSDSMGNLTHIIITNATPLVHLYCIIIRVTGLVIYNPVIGINSINR